MQLPARQISSMDHAGGDTVHGLQSVKSGENDGLLLMALRDFSLSTISLCGILACSNLVARITNRGFQILFLLCRGLAAAVNNGSCRYLLSPVAALHSLLP